MLRHEHARTALKAMYPPLNGWPRHGPAAICFGRPSGIRKARDNLPQPIPSPHTSTGLPKTTINLPRGSDQSGATTRAHGLPWSIDMVQTQCAPPPSSRTLSPGGGAAAVERFEHVLDGLCPVRVVWAALTRSRGGEGRALALVGGDWGLLGGLEGLGSCTPLGWSDLERMSCDDSCLTR